MMKTKSGKSHWKCTTVTKRCSGETVEEFRFTTFDGKKHMDKIKRDYCSHGIVFEYYNLVNLDE